MTLEPGSKMLGGVAIRNFEVRVGRQEEERRISRRARRGESLAQASRGPNIRISAANGLRFFVSAGVAASFRGLREFRSPAAA